MHRIGSCNNSGVLISVLRDDHGKFYIENNGLVTQKRLTATELCNWFLNAMHTDVVKVMSDDMLRKQTDEFLKSGRRIEAIKYARQHRDWGLKEGLDYIKLSKYY